jgi:hypothetical protein
MPLFRNRKARDRFTRWFTIVFLFIFVAAIAGGLIIAGIASHPGTPVPIGTPTP